MKKCRYCGKEFQPKNPKGVFCSDKCRVYHGRGVATKPAKEKILPAKVGMAKQKPLKKEEPKEEQTKPSVNLTYQQRRLNQKLGLKP